MKRDTTHLFGTFLWWKLSEFLRVTKNYVHVFVKRHEPPDELATVLDSDPHSYLGDRERRRERERKKALVYLEEMERVCVFSLFRLIQKSAPGRVDRLTEVDVVQHL